MTCRHGLRWLIAVVVLAVLGGVPRSPAQTLVATARSAGKLADNLEYLTRAVMPEESPELQPALEALKRFKEGQLLKGLDKDRLFGVSITVPKEPGGVPTVVAAVPVTEYAPFLDSLKEAGMTVDADSGVPGFSHKVSTPDGAQTVFALEAKGYAIFSLIPSRAETLSKLDPATWRPAGAPQSDLCVVLNLADLPDAIKDQFLNGLEASQAKEQAQRPGESDAEYKGRKMGTRVASDAIKTLVRESESLNLAMTIDRSRDEIVFDLTTTARPNTALARSLGGLGGRKSAFARLGHGAPFSAWLSAPVAKELTDSVAEILENAQKEAKAKDDAEKLLVERLTSITKDALTSGDLDMGVAIQGPVKNADGKDRFTLIGGIAVRNGKDVDRVIRDVFSKATPESGLTLKQDAAITKDGTQIHHLIIPERSLDPKLVTQFGGGGVFLAVSGNTLLVAFGDEGLKALQQGCEDLARPTTPADASEPPASLQTHLTALGQISGQTSDAVRKAEAEIFSGTQKGRDRLTLTMNGQGQALLLRLTVDVSAVKYAAQLGQKPPSP